MKKAALIFTGIIIGVLVLIGAYSGGATLASHLGKATVPPDIQAKYNDLNQQYVYATQREKELLDKIVDAQPADPALPTYQADVKKYRSDKARLQREFAKLVAEFNKKK